jgi:hypothetical protein
MKRSGTCIHINSTDPLSLAGIQLVEPTSESMISSIGLKRISGDHQWFGHNRAEIKGKAKNPILSTWDPGNPLAQKIELFHLHTR